MDLQYRGSLERRHRDMKGLVGHMQIYNGFRGPTAFVECSRDKMEVSKSWGKSP